MLKRLNSIFKHIVDGGAIVAALLYLFIMLAVSLGVVMRYFVKSPLLWVVEITSYALLYLTFLGAAWLLKKEGHVTMDFVVDQLKPRTQNIIEAVTSFVVAIMFLIIAYYGVLVTWEHFEKGLYDAHGILKICDAYPLAIIPIGSILLSIQLLGRAWTRLHHQQEATPEPKQVSTGKLQT